MKFNFESAPKEETGGVESEKKEQSVFERLAKSKPARAIAFAAALFGAAATMESRGFDTKERETSTIEAVENDELKLEDLAKKFNVDVQVPGGEKTILHIAQKHGENTLKETRRIDKVITSQKRIEELLTYLKDKGLVDSVYTEGLNKEYKAFIDGPKHMESERIFEIAKVLNDPSLGYSEMRQANWLYSAKCELLQRAKKLEIKYAESLKSGVDDKEMTAQIERSKTIAHEIGENALIKGDNVYVWGTSFKMYAEGKIDLRSAETAEADEATMAPHTLKEAIPAVLEMGNKPAFRHRIREDAALELIAKDIPNLKQKIVPLVYGESHNFKEAINEYDKKSGNHALGLTRVAPAQEK